MNAKVLIQIILSFKVFLLTRADDFNQQEKFKYNMILDNDNRVRLEWNVNLNEDEKMIRFKIIVVMVGSSKELMPIIGFGMSDRGDFKNADLVLIETKDNINFKIIDSYTNSESELIKDFKQNYRLISSRTTYPDGKVNKQIEIVFDRLINTCDKNDYLIEAGTVHTVYFLFKPNSQFSDVADILRENFVIEKDANEFGMKQVQLIKSTFYEKGESSSGINLSPGRYFDITNRKIKLPSQHTTYWCMVYKLDKKFIDKHHIIGFEGLITNTSKGIVHHMELFHCITDPSESTKTYNGECKSEAKPEGLSACRKVIAAWAMGASRFVFPENAGGVIGGPNYSPYLVLEVHYDNPNLKNNIIDSSGLRIYYQGGLNEPLRKYDAGIMEIGLEYNPKNSIPPKMNSFHLHGYCLSECTRASLPSPEGITVFASQLHTHLTGRRVWTSLIRNNKVINILNSDNHYDQMFQEIRLLRKPIRVRPGDSLVNTCVYETQDRINMTFGGYSIRDEMCVNYMHYYPASKLEVCKSSIRDDVLSKYFETMREYDFADTSSQKSIETNFNSIRWTPLTSRILSKLYDLSPLSFSCNSSDGKQIKEAYSMSNNFFEAINVEDLRSDYAPLDKEINDECFPDMM